MREEILFSKYKVLNVLKENEKCRVLLVTHVVVGGRRIVKQILKNEEGQESFTSEVNILKILNFQGIPQLFDTEESEDYYYIMEEYIEGETLFEIVEKEGSFSIEKAIFYIKQLASIMEYLHNQKPEAIIHLDIQPKNIIIREEQVYLIDFGNASCLPKAENKHYLKGTPYFAAPEQYQDGMLNVTADIYGMGACLLYMVTGERELIKERIPKEIQSLVFGCMESNAEKRFQSVRLFLSQLSEIENDFEKEKQRNSKITNTCLFTQKQRESSEKNYPKIISVAGVMNRVGTSYIAMGLVHYLLQMGISVSYEENNDSNMVRIIVRKNSQITYKNGYFYYEKCPLKPKYNKNVSFSNGEELVIRDEGIFDAEKEYEGQLILIAGLREWEEDALCKAAELLRKKCLKETELKTLWIFNLPGRIKKNTFLSESEIKGIYMPYLEEWYDENGYEVFAKVREWIGI